MGLGCFATMRWLVDGMNVIGSRPDGWWRDREAAMRRLVEQLERWAAGREDDVTVVFERPLSRLISAGAVRLAYGRPGGPDAADHEIVRRVEADPRPSEVIVVTSDRRLADRVTAAGGAVRPASSFRELLEAGWAPG